MTPQEALDRVKLYLIQEDREAQDWWEAERGTIDLPRYSPNTFRPGDAEEDIELHR